MAKSKKYHDIVHCLEREDYIRNLPPTSEERQETWANLVERSRRVFGSSSWLQL